MIGRIEKNFSYTIPDGPHAGRTLWSGRYCCIVGIIIKIVNGEYYILANQRGSGTPDFQGFWNCPCGFLEGNESAEQGVAREVFEETGVIVDPKNLRLHSVQSDPKVCNNGNVTLRYFCYDYHYNETERSGGEENEVADVKWIHAKDINNYQWAFNHDELIKMFIDD